MTMTITVYQNELKRSATPDEMATLIHDFNSVLWIDVTLPDDHAVALLGQVFQFHPLTLEDVRTGQQRPRLVPFEDYAFLILTSLEITRDDEPQWELDVFVGVNYLVTVHPPGDAAAVVVAAQAHCDARKNTLPLSAGYLLYVTLRTVVAGYRPRLNKLDDQIAALEDAIQTDANRELLRELFALQRDIIEMTSLLENVKEIVDGLVSQEFPFVRGQNVRYYVRDVKDQLAQDTDLLEGLNDVLHSLVNLYMTASSNQLNRAVSRLSVYALVVGVATVVSGFYGMNFERTWPPFDAPWGVPFVIATIIIGSVGMITLIKWRRVL